VTRGSVNGGFVCSVAGKRRGKGSSREQSPYAELMAGIQVVVAESIERIYNENCQNLGMLTTTDFGIVERIRRARRSRWRVFTEGKDEITRQIIEYGGLFEFNVARLQGKATVPAAAAQAPDAPARRPMTRGREDLRAALGGGRRLREVGVPWVSPARRASSAPTSASATSTSPP
jgi:3-isopropylmalate/(R)-2-methylmalate dehydratase large subunit